MKTCHWGCETTGCRKRAFMFRQHSSKNNDLIITTNYNQQRESCQRMNGLRSLSSLLLCWSQQLNEGKAATCCFLACGLSSDPQSPSHTPSNMMLSHRWQAGWKPTNTWRRWVFTSAWEAHCRQMDYLNNTRTFQIYNERVGEWFF